MCAAGLAAPRHSCSVARSADSVPQAGSAGGRAPLSLLTILGRDKGGRLGASGGLSGLPASVDLSTPVSGCADDSATRQNSSVQRGPGAQGEGCCRPGQTRTGSPGLLQHILPGTQEGWRVPSDTELETVQPVRAENHFPHGDTAHSARSALSRPLDDERGPQRRILPCVSSPRVSRVPQVPVARVFLPIRNTSVWPHYCATSVYEGPRSGVCIPENSGCPLIRLPRRHSHSSGITGAVSAINAQSAGHFDSSGICGELEEVRTLSHPGHHLHRGEIEVRLEHGLSAGRSSGGTAQVPSHLPQGGLLQASPPLVETTGPHGGHSFSSPVRQITHATHSVACQTEVVTCPEPQGSYLSDAGGGHASRVVAVGGQPQTRHRLSQATGGLHGRHRRVVRGLGWTRSQRRQACRALRRPVVSRRDKAAHQCARAQSHSPHAPTTGTPHSRSTHPGGVRQYHSGVVHQQAGRSSVPYTHAGDQSVVQVPQGTRDPGDSDPQAGGRQCPRGLLVEEPAGPSRMGNEQDCGTEALQPLGNSSGRRLRVIPELPAAVLVCSEPTPGCRCLRCFDGSVDGDDILYVSAGSTISSDLAEDQNRSSGGGDPDCSHLASQDMVPVVTPTGMRDAEEVADPDGSPVADTSGSGQNVSFRPEDAELGSLAADRRTLQGAGLSEAATITALAAVRSSSRTVYDARWAGWSSWCRGRHLDPVSAPVSDILDFLQDLVDQGRAVNTIQGYITAISNRHEAVDNSRVGSHILVHQWRKGLKNLVGINRTLVPPWNLDLVLTSLTKAPYEPLRQAPLKFLTWKTVFLVAITSARRASEIHALRCDPPYITFNATGVTMFPDIQFLPKVNSRFACSQAIEVPAMHHEQDQKLRSLCVRRALKYYLERTRAIRLADSCQLFVAYGRSIRGQPISKIRISQWLKLLIVKTYKDLELPEPQGVKGHQVRKQAVSMAELVGVSPQAICEAATWASTCTFAKCYRLNLVEQQRSDFGRRVLQVAGSSKSSGTKTTVPREQTSQPQGGTLSGYRIPKLKK